MNANCVDERALVGFVQVIACVGVHIPSHIAGIGYLGFRMYIIILVYKGAKQACHQRPFLAQEDLVNDNQPANCFYRQQLFFVQALGGYLIKVGTIIPRMYVKSGGGSKRTYPLP